MATSRRRPTTPKPVIKEVAPTHEEMIEIAEEREEESVAAFLDAISADAFEALQIAEEEKGLDNFFDPDSYKEKEEVKLIHPAPAVPQPPKRENKRDVVRVVPNRSGRVRG